MKTLAIIIAGLMLASACMAEDPLWLSSFAQAQKVAAEKNLPVLASFTGSDWCPWCMKLEREVFSQAAFKAYAATNLVLFQADFPRTRQLPAEEKRQNETLAEKYKVEGFPTVLLLDASGKLLASPTGYRPGGAAAYVELLKGLLKPAAPAGK